MGSRYVFLLVAAVVLLTGCVTTKYVPIETVKTEYRTRDSVRVDSVHTRDSVYIVAKGDTVYKTTYKWRDRYKQVVVRDTVLRTDTVPRVVEVEKKKTFFDRAGDWLVAVPFAVLGTLIILNAAKR